MKNNTEEIKIEKNADNVQMTYAESQKKIINKEIKEWVLCLVIALFLAFIIKFYFGTFTTVRQLSMYPTLQDSNKLWLDRTTRTFNLEYKRGDIITFEAPQDIYSPSDINPKAKFINISNGLDKFVYNFLELGKKSLIKRIIAMPGEHVEIKNGYVYINGEKLIEDYLPSDVKTTTTNLKDFIVPDGTYFVMGDNRLKSSDSRIFGCIPKDKIEGRLLIRIWPLNELGKVN